MDKRTLKHIESECKRVFSAIPALDSLSKDGKREIVSALDRVCRSNDHVTAVLQKFQETVLHWQNPVAELVRLAREGDSAIGYPEYVTFAERIKRGVM